MEATFDHAPLHGDAVRGSYGAAQKVLDDLAAVGIDYDDVTALLEKEGVEKFIVSWNELLDTVSAALEAAQVSVTVAATGAAAEAVDRLVPRLIADHVASRHHVARPDPLGPGRRGRGRQAPRLDRGGRDLRAARRRDPRACATNCTTRASRHIVLGGMGGSSLAPEVITRTYGVPLTVLDATDPGQVRAALGRPSRADRGRDLVQVGLDRRDRQPEARLRGGLPRRGHRPADAHHHRHRSRLAARRPPRAPTATASSTPTPTSAAATRRSPPSGSCRADWPASTSAELLDEAQAIAARARARRRRQPGPRARRRDRRRPSPLKDKLGIVADGTHIVGFADWAEQLIAESTGKQGRACFPSCWTSTPPSSRRICPTCRSCAWSRTSERPTRSTRARSRSPARSAASCWSGSTRRRSPAASSASTRSISPTSSRRRSPRAACSTPARSRRSPPSPADGIEVRAAGPLAVDGDTLGSAVDALLGPVPDDGYIAVQAYLDRVAHPEVAGLRDLLAARARRPVTFGWGPRFLHSTGQFHKGGPAVGVFLQLVRRRRRGPRDPGPPVHLRAAHPGSGRRRRERARRSRPTGAEPDPPRRARAPSEHAPLAAIG